MIEVVTFVISLFFSGLMRLVNELFQCELINIWRLFRVARVIHAAAVEVINVVRLPFGREKRLLLLVLWVNTRIPKTKITSGRFISVCESIQASFILMLEHSYWCNHHDGDDFPHLRIFPIRSCLFFGPNQKVKSTHSPKTTNTREKYNIYQINARFTWQRSPTVSATVQCSHQFIVHHRTLEILTTTISYFMWLLFEWTKKMRTN